MGQGEAFAGVGGGGGAHEQGAGFHPEGFAGFVRQAAADQQRNPTAGPHFIDDRVGLQAEGADHLARFVGDFALVGIDGDHVARVHLGHVTLDRQGPGIFRRVEENRRNLAAQNHAAGPLVGNVGNVVADVPQHGVDRRFARRPRTDHVTHIGDRVALGLQLRQQAQGFRHLGFQHGQGVQRNIGAGGGVGGGRKVVGVGFAGHFQHRDGDRFGQLGLADEPSGVGPSVDRLFGVGVALRQFQHIVERIKGQRNFAEGGGGGLGNARVLRFQQTDQGLHVVATDHLPQDGDCALGGD